MRRTSWKSCIKVWIAFLVCAFLCLACKAGNVVRLSNTEGERTFYLHTPSSQAVQTQTLSLLQTFFVEGESVVFERENTDMGAAVQEILDEYGGAVLWEEEACGVTSVYAFSPNLAGGIYVNGRYVNLHIAYTSGRMAVGSPMIFGGF